jgi:hypothetical protein
MDVCPRGFEPHPYYQFFYVSGLFFSLQLLQAKWAKHLSDVGFEPTPTFVDQNALTRTSRKGVNLESGALDHSANLTDGRVEMWRIHMTKSR